MINKDYYYHPLTIASPDILSIGFLFHGLIRSLANYVVFHQILKLHVFCETYFFYCLLVLVILTNCIQEACLIDPIKCYSYLSSQWKPTHFVMRAKLRYWVSFDQHRNMLFFHVTMLYIVSLKLFTLNVKKNMFIVNIVEIHLANVRKLQIILSFEN